MSNKIILLSAFLCLFGSLNAQKKYEISASYGTPSLYGLAYDFFDEIFNPSENSTSNKISGQGVATVGASMYSQNQKWQFELNLMNEFFNDEKSSVTTDANFFSVHPNVNYMWRKPDKKFQVYSGAGIGLSFLKMNYTDRFTKEKYKDKKTVVTWNITPIGLKYGKDYGVFATSNFGIKSFGQIGVFYKL